MNQQSLSAFVWSIADLLRGDYRQSEYGRVILPFTVLRRLDCVLEGTKAAVLAEHKAKQAMGISTEPNLVDTITDQLVQNASRFRLHDVSLRKTGARAIAGGPAS
jgi:type I restriction enzyme M protein